MQPKGKESEICSRFEYWRTKQKSGLYLSKKKKNTIYREGTQNILVILGKNEMLNYNKRLESVFLMN